MNKKKGFIAIIVLFFVIAIALAVAPIIMQNISFHALSEPERAFFLAESGIQYYIKHELDLSDDDWSDNTATITKTFGGGSFTVSVLQASTNRVELRSVGTVTLGSTDFDRTIEYAIRRINPFSYLLYGEGDATFEHINNGTIDGDIYLEGDFDTEHDANVTVDGDIDENQSDAEIPEVDWTYWQNEADQIISGDYVFDQTSYSGIYYIDGNATLDNNNIDFDGTLIVTGNIESMQNNNIEINPDSNRPALVTGGNLNIAQGNNMIINGAVYAENNLTLNQATNLILNGSLIFGGDFFADNTNNITLNFVEGDNTGFTGGTQSYGLDSFKEIGG